MEFNNSDITQGYQPLPKDKWGCDITPTEEADKDCICCWVKVRFNVVLVILIIMTLVIVS